MSQSKGRRKARCITSVCLYVVSTITCMYNTCVACTCRKCKADINLFKPPVYIIAQQPLCTVSLDIF